MKKTDIKTSPHKLKFMAITSLLLMLCLAITTNSAAEKDKDTGEIKNNVYNKHDSEMGRVDEKGVIYNNYGVILGSVNKEGIIFNANDIEIGKVELDGSVLNQSETRVGSVNGKGEILNVSDIKIGYVKDITDIKLIGGVARVIFFKSRYKSSY